MTDLRRTLSMIGPLILAIPAGLAGVESILRGRVAVGTTLLGLAVGLLALTWFLGSLPGLRGPGRLAGRGPGSGEE